MKTITVPSSPHIGGRRITASLMRDVVIALIPTTLAGLWFQGIRAFWVLFLSIGAALVTEQICTKGKTNGSALVTGVLLGLSLPSSVSWWIPVVGSVVSVFGVKHLCGGLGRNVFNPVLVARAFLLLVFPLQLTRFGIPGMDGLTSSTPLHAFQVPTLPDVGLGTLLWGNVSGCIGETSKLAVLLGGLYLIDRKVIRPEIPMAYLGSFVLLSLIFSQGQPPLLWMGYQLLTGSVLLSAFFLATDYTSSPATPGGRIVYGVACGALTVLFRRFGLFPEGSTYAILCMNPFVWALDQGLAPRVFGHSKGREKGGHRER